MEPAGTDARPQPGVLCRTSDFVPPQIANTPAARHGALSDSLAETNVLSDIEAVLLPPL